MVSKQDATKSEQCPHWKCTDNLKSDFRDQVTGRWMCFKELKFGSAKSEQEKVLDILHDKVPTYPSDLGDMMLVSDIEEELRKGEQP